jgi:hypothetical protein
LCPGAGDAMSTGDRIIDTCCIIFISMIGVVSTILIMLYHMGVIV